MVAMFGIEATLHVVSGSGGAPMADAAKAAAADAQEEQPLSDQAVAALLKAAARESSRLPMQTSPGR